MIRRLASAAAGAAALAGAAVAVVPQHAASLVALATATVAVVAAAFLVVLAGPLVTAERPPSVLDGAARATSPAALDPQGLRDARRDLTARSAGPLPASVQDRLRTAGERRGVELADLARPAPDPGVVRSDPAAVARRVHLALDHLEHLATGGNP